MPRIQILPQTLVNRIAAGECVERPASVVKELVENSLDAGASRVDVSIVEGGRDLIQVQDDGCGLDADDLTLAVHPHATSKLSADEDLFNIHTLGFRGEALASIGSVSRLTITSRPGSSDVAHRIRVDAGRVEPPAPCQGPPGTTIEVRDLFYCVPARRKFLRTNQTETGQITEQFGRIALAHPGIAFSLRSGPRTLHELAATDNRLRRIRDYLGPELADVLLPIERSTPGVRVEGYVAPPAESRGSGKWEYVFVNGRFVRDRFVSHAVKEAYRGLIDPSRYPVVFLYITIDPGHVDVNVHPTKIEVRWRDSNYIHGQVLAALRDRFLTSRLDQRLRTPAESDEYRERVRSAMVDFFARSGRSTAPPRSEPMPHYPQSRQGHLAEAPGETAGGRVSASDFARQPGRPPETASTRPAVPVDTAAPAGSANSPPDAASVGDAPRPTARALQIHNSYLVVETDEGLMIIDQHALHERILYEELAQRIMRRPLESQRLLLPEVVRVPPDRIEALETHAETLARLGIELTASGPQSVTLHAFPSLLDRANRDEFVRDLLDKLAERGARPGTETLLHELLDMMSCKAAVKAGDPLTADEIAALLARKDAAERSSNCPHGRPTTLRLSLYELEKQFKRR